jgi:anthranilate synthase component II
MENILIIDNYDSFTYNLVQIVEENFSGTIDVFRNDEISPNEAGNYEGIILSPGPGIPDEAGNLKSIIEQHASKKKIFGVCLGLQAIAEVFGGKLINLDHVFHGVKTEMKVINSDDIILKNVPEEFEAGRYHSWVVDPENIPDSLEITCIDEQNQIMAMRHIKYQVNGVQFHPESIMTKYGKQMIINFLEQ